MGSNEGDIFGTLILNIIFSEIINCYKSSRTYLKITVCKGKLKKNKQKKTKFINFENDI